MSSRVVRVSRSDCWARIVRILDHWPDIASLADGTEWSWELESIKSLVWLAEGERVDLQEQP